MNDPIASMNEEELRSEIKRLRKRNHEISDASNRKLASYQAGFDWIRKINIKDWKGRDSRVEMYVRRNEFEWAGICVYCDFQEMKRRLEKKC